MCCFNIKMSHLWFPLIKCISWCPLGRRRRRKPGLNNAGGCNSANLRELLKGKVICEGSGSSFEAPFKMPRTMLIPCFVEGQVQWHIAKRLLICSSICSRRCKFYYKTVWGGFIHCQNWLGAFLYFPGIGRASKLAPQSSFYDSKLATESVLFVRMLKRRSKFLQRKSDSTTHWLTHFCRNLWLCQGQRKKKPFPGTKPIIILETHSFFVSFFLPWVRPACYFIV